MRISDPRCSAAAARGTGWGRARGGYVKRLALRSGGRSRFRRAPEVTLRPGQWAMEKVAQ